MKVQSSYQGMALSQPRYEAPGMEVVEVVIEHGFDMSSGFEGPYYDEEDIIW